MTCSLSLHRSCLELTMLGVGVVLALLLFSALQPGRASAQAPSVACPPFTDITITQQPAGSGLLTVQMQPPVQLGSTGAPDSQSFRLYYFIDRVAAIYSSNRAVQQLLGGDVLPDGSAQAVQRLAHGDVQTIDLSLSPGSHSVAAVLAVGDVTCNETRPQPDPCSYVCGPPRTLLIGSAEVIIGPPQIASTHPSSGQATGSVVQGTRGDAALLLLVTVGIFALVGMILRTRPKER